MKNKSVFILIVSIVLCGLLIYIAQNRKSKAKKKAEIERIEERKKFVQDSLRLDNENKIELKRIEQKNIEISNRIERENAERLRLIETEKIAAAKRIDGYTNKISTKLDVVILIIDDTGQSTDDISSKIASIYRDQGFFVSNSLFTSSFIKRYRKRRKKYNSDILSLEKQSSFIHTVQFEDFVLSEEYRNQLAQKIGLDLKDQDKHCFFKPWESEKNIDNYKRFSKQDEINKIEQELPEYLYEI